MLTGLTDNNGTMVFNYDDLNRLANYTDFYGNQVQYQYDLASNIKKIIYPGNKAVDYTYYDDNLLHTITDWLGNTTTYTYRDDGSMQRLDYPNGTYLEYSYDGAGRITGMHSKKSNGEIIASYTYTLDAMGNHLSVNTQEPLEFPGIASADISYSYDNANRITTAGETTFAHDLNGNLILKNENGTNTTFTYNAEDMLTGISGAFNASYVYDGMGKRRAATRNGVTIRYVLDINSSMEHVLIETNSSNAPQYYYIHGNGLIYRIRAADNAAQYYHYDYRGSTIAITNHAQNITHKYAYDEFGKVLDAEEADFNPYRFVGGHGVIFENEELYFMRARYYAPCIGRFVSEDPVWFPNLYVYANNNPAAFIDPNGEMAYDSFLYNITHWVDKPYVVYGAEIGVVAFSTLASATPPGAAVAAGINTLPFLYDMSRGEATYASAGRNLANLTLSGIGLSSDKLPNAYHFINETFSLTTSTYDMYNAHVNLINKLNRER
jgi:RHS repeat-associated protein